MFANSTSSTTKVRKSKFASEETFQAKLIFAGPAIVVRIQEICPLPIAPLCAADPPLKEIFVCAKNAAFPPTDHVNDVLSKAAPTESVAAAPNCVTVIVWPAAVIVPVLELELVLAATEKLTSPVPMPFAPDEIVTQLSFAVTFQEHPLPLVIVRVPLAGSDEKERLSE